MTQDQIIEKGLEAPDEWQGQSKFQAMIEAVAAFGDALRQCATEVCKVLGPAIRALAICLRRWGFAYQLIHRWRLHSRLARRIAWHLPDTLILKLPDDWVEWKIFPTILD